uniref:Uncharacterized protein n=1 Tax=Arundo donax TaxID=35708 RepID=A0A0A9A1Q2_ARUDO
MRRGAHLGRRLRAAVVRRPWGRWWRRWRFWAAGTVIWA